MNIGSKIVELRKSKNLTQAELSEKLHINRSVLNRIELGTRPLKDDELLMLASFFNVSTDYLLGWKKATSPEEEKEDANLLEILFKNDPTMKMKLKSVHIDGKFNDGKKVCDLSAESIARIEDAIRISFERDELKGRSVVEIDE